MNHDRRVLLSVASAAVLALVALVLNRVLGSAVEGGWFMYAPDSAPPALGGRAGDGEVLRGAAVWLVAIGLWLGFSWRLFREGND